MLLVDTMPTSENVTIFFGFLNLVLVAVIARRLVRFQTTPDPVPTSPPTPLSSHCETEVSLPVTSHHASAAATMNTSVRGQQRSRLNDFLAEEDVDAYFHAPRSTAAIDALDLSGTGAHLGDEYALRPTLRMPRHLLQALEASDKLERSLYA